MWKAIKLFSFALFSIICIENWTGNWLYVIFLILLRGDVERNPGLDVILMNPFPFTS